VVEQKIAILGNCLTWIAAFADEAACQSLDRNRISAPPNSQDSADVRAVVHGR